VGQVASRDSSRSRIAAASISVVVLIACAAAVHGRGDDVLAAVAATLDGTVRDSDFVGRYGGEEFIVLLPDTWRREAAMVAEKVRSAVAAISVPGVPRAITISIGVAVMPDDAGESVSLLQHAGGSTPPREAGATRWCRPMPVTAHMPTVRWSAPHDLTVTSEARPSASLGAGPC